MTSRRKGKRINWIYFPSNMFTHTGRPLGWEMKWYETGWVEDLKYGRYNCPISYPDSMWGCVKKSKQQKHRGSWNRVGIDPWYSKGLISWNRH